jgi:hypothetical protein
VVVGVGVVLGPPAVEQVFEVDGGRRGEVTGTWARGMKSAEESRATEKRR